MVKRLVVVFAILAMAMTVALAGTVPAVRTNFKVTLVQPSVVNGTELKPGEYKLSLGDNKITLVLGKVSVEAPAKIETVESKFDNTAVRYQANGTKQVVAEIRLGGSKTRVVLNP